MARVLLLMARMINLTRVRAASAVSLVATILGGCAVAAAPDPVNESAPGPAEHVAPRSVSTVVSPAPPISFCFPPITPMTGDWSCGASNVRTGEKQVTTTAGYTNNCSGRVTVEYSTPKCALPTPVQRDEIHVEAVGLSVSSAAACAASYLDYTITALGTTAGTWSTLSSGRAHGAYLPAGTCVLSVESDPVSSDWSQFEISADAYQPEYVYFGGRELTLLAPVNVLIDASFLDP